jgi:hypothetical protein
MPDPNCQGFARFDSEEQAEYVAMSESDVQGTPWRHRPCGDHWHVEEEPVSPEQFVCGACGKTFEKGRSDEEAEAEMRELWGDLPPEDQVVICSDCFEKFWEWWTTEGAET